MIKIASQEQSAYHNTSPMVLTERGKTVRKIGLLAATATIGVGLTYVISQIPTAEAGVENTSHKVTHIEASDKTHTLIAHPGDTISSLVINGGQNKKGKFIEGAKITSLDGIASAAAAYDAVNLVKSSPENEATVKDGVLQVGEPVVVADSYVVSAENE